AEAQEDEREAEGNEEDEFDWDEFINSPDDLYGYKARVDHSAEEEQREVPMPYKSTMAEHLRDQLGLLDLDEHQAIIAEQIIGSIEEDGYLRRSIDSIVDDIMFSQGLMLTEDDVEAVLKKIQRLDPPGIGCRDLQECLLIQLEVLPDDVDGREDAIDMVRDAYKAFTMKHFDQIMRKLGIGEEELKEAYDLVQRLNPKPGEGAFAPSTNYVTPDFTVEFVDDEFIISLNGRNAPELRINRHYRRMWNNLSAEKKKSGLNGKGDETRQFLKSRMESARWFINSINQRRATMLKVMRAIVELQEEFFRNGEGNLKPMILKDVAERIGMDISTISRVVNGKYVQTEWGVYELKYFFSEGLTTDSGEEVSNKEVKAIIERIIAEEDKEKPLSDQKIATMLEERGFQIARRTVTKYREQLHIPVARLRKEIVLA
ncbi:MAG: RNA polymerase factor sigma-54, partial [Rhodothermales bacterium]|nr:RNA polymerase factor sigma-54 [Rhodothermales bacterium]